MSNKLKIMCATLVITLMPMGSICYAKTNQANSNGYKTIWVQDEKKENNKLEEKTMNSEDEVKEMSLAEILEISKDQERCKSVKNKNVCMKIIVHKVDKNDECYLISTKDGMLKKGEFKISKEENSKLVNIKKGDEIILQGTVKDLSNKKVTLENTKILKVNEKNKNSKKEECHKKNEHHKKHEHHDKCDEHKKDCEPIKKEKKDCDDHKRIEENKPEENQ